MAIIDSYSESLRSEIFYRKHCSIVDEQYIQVFHQNNCVGLECGDNCLINLRFSSIDRK